MSMATGAVVRGARVEKMVGEFVDDGNDQDKYYEELAPTKSSLPADAKKYWADRYVLFRQFDEGIHLTPELWYSVTPEDVAIFVAKFIRDCNPEARVVMDLFCGGGGNTIQFARFFKGVVAVDYNGINLKCTLHNARVYNVGRKVEAVQYDWSRIQTAEGQILLQQLRAKVDVVFASPPWGGPSYSRHKSYDLDQLQPLPLLALLESCFAIADNVCLFLPRNCDPDQLAQATAALNRPRCKLLYVHHTGRLKGICAFWGQGFFF